MIGPFLGKHAFVGWMIGLPGCLDDDLRVLSKGLPTAIFEEFHKGPSLFPFLGGCSPWGTSRPAASSSSALAAAASWSDEGCHHLGPDGAASILETADGGTATGSSPPTIVNGGVLASMATSSMLSVRISKGYTSAP